MMKAKHWFRGITITALASVILWAPSLANSDQSLSKPHEPTLISSAFLCSSKKCSNPVPLALLTVPHVIPNAPHLHITTLPPAHSPARTPALSSGVIISLISSYDWPIPIALAIAKAESGLNPNALHRDSDGSIDRGIFQINSVHGAHSTFDVQQNISFAYQLYKSQGFAPWTTYKSGSYKRYL